jgi:hypothetical protein
VIALPRRAVARAVADLAPEMDDGREHDPIMRTRLLRYGGAAVLAGGARTSEPRPLRASRRRLRRRPPSDPMGVSSGGCCRLLVDAPRIARSSTGRGLSPRPRPHIGGRRPCRTVCVGSGWTFTRTRAPWRCSTTSPGEVTTRRVNGRPLEVLDVLRELPGPVRAVYEAGPTGYRLESSPGTWCNRSAFTSSVRTWAAQAGWSSGTSSLFSLFM